jgi:hypothetical protein
MNKKLVPYYEYAKSQLAMGVKMEQLLDDLKTRGATLAVAIRTLEELGVALDTIDVMLSTSIAWKNQFRSFEDLFFDFVELDNDAITTGSED